MPSCLSQMMFINNTPPCLQTMNPIPNPKHLAHKFVDLKKKTNLILQLHFSSVHSKKSSVQRSHLQFSCDCNIKYDTSKSIPINKPLLQLKNIRLKVGQPKVIESKRYKRMINLNSKVGWNCNFSITELESNERSLEITCDFT